MQSSTSVAVAGSGSAASPYIMSVGFIWMIECSDETTELVAADPIKTFRSPFACQFNDARASINGVSASGGPIIIDIKESGSTLLGTKLTIDDGEESSLSAPSPTIIDNSIADDAEITIVLVDAGSGATGLKIAMYVVPI